MIYPIVAYGDPVLRTKAQDIPLDSPELEKLIEDMYETMYHAHGVGLAAPQIGKSIRLFVIDSKPFMEEGQEEKGVKQAFINPVILEESGEEWGFDEGCLSIPGVREEVWRQENIKIRYYDLQGQEHIEEFDDLTARVIQHEYDHIEGILFTDHLSALKKRLLKGKLTKITKGDVDADYRMKFPGSGKR
ncbi:peptide deformylase [Rufibacter glacialis]|uniref:Peptide deformylase n=1 Tax=Rufibacter glacialis TaxID=1259555 RepID=A0A5M8QFL0_9BACT|nr:peptide deformylase [Rufibacter glacialis]KAA6433212.1 peptide deformylase [Rufibacter glacialis]GGK76416.1 peptide deformylase [Rufibacter glacialis]